MLQHLEQVTAGLVDSKAYLPYEVRLVGGPRGLDYWACEGIHKVSCRLRVYSLKEES